MESYTKNWQRIVIWIIAIVLTVGTLGFYFVIIMQNNKKPTAVDQSQTSQTNNEPTEELKVDPSAYIVEGDITELKIEDVAVGSGEEVKPGDNVKVHYKGTIAQTGQKFDSSYDRGEPIEFGLDGVIVGWQEGIPGMKVGGKRRLIIPSEMAYGAQSVAGIPANSDLVFEVELLDVKHAE